MTLEKMIEKARKYAEMAKKATPGPWGWCSGDRHSGVNPHILQRTGRIVHGTYLIATAGPDGRSFPPDHVCYRDATLIASAPEMAELLGKMADVLEDLMEAKKSFQNTTWETLRESMFVSGSPPEDMLKTKEETLGRIMSGAKGRWWDDYEALAEASYEAGWDDAVMYVLSVLETKGREDER